MGKKIPTTLLVLVTLLSLFPLLSISIKRVQAHSGDVLIGEWATKIPEIDGLIDVQEWSEARKYHVYFFEVETSEYCEAYVYVYASAEGLLYIAVDAVGDTSSPNDGRWHGLAVTFDVGHDGVKTARKDCYYVIWYKKGQSPNPLGIHYIWDGSDWKEHCAGPPNHPIRLAVSWSISPDSDSKHWNYELQIPLSGVEGIYTKPGETVGIYFAVYFFEKWYIWPSIDYADLQLKAVSCSLISPSNAHTVTEFPMILQARVTSDGGGLQGASVSFYIDGAYVGSSSSDSSGYASFSCSPSIGSHNWYASLEELSVTSLTWSFTYSPSMHSLTINTNPGLNNVLFMIDGKSGYTDSEGMLSVSILQGTHTIELIDTMVTVGPTRYIFNSWVEAITSTENPIKIMVTSPTTLTATFKSQHYLGVNSKWGTISGEGWYDAGTTATFSVASPVSGGIGTRYVFTRWSGDSTATTTSATILMDSPKTVTASWKTQHYLAVNSPFGNPTGSGWYDEGSEATFSVTSPFDHGNQTRRAFVRWSEDSMAQTTESFIVMDKPHAVVAIWKTQYYLTVGSDFGDPQGEGWYDKGETATFSVTSPVGIIIQQIFDGWGGDFTTDTPTATITMNSPKTVVANWRTDYTRVYLVIMGALAAIVACVMFMKLRSAGS